MEFALRAAKSGVSSISVSDSASLNSVYRSSPWIARPLALKSDAAEMLYRSADGGESYLYPWASSDSSGRTEVYPARGTARSQPLQVRGDAVKSWDLTRTITSDWKSPFREGESLPQSSGIRLDLSAAKTPLAPENGPKTPALHRATQDAPSGGGASPRAPSVGKDRPTHARPLEKRSAFREVTKRRHRADGVIQSGTAQLKERAGGREAKERLKRTAEDGALVKRYDVLPGNQGVPSSPFYSFPQSVLSMYTGSLQSQRHFGGFDLQEPFQASPYLPLKRPTQTDYPAFIPDTSRLRVREDPYKDKLPLQFGALHKGATNEQLSPLSFPWQPPLVPTSVMPLTSSVSSPQYDNWCAKCNASFRMTSDLVYHMRTQHKRSSSEAKNGAKSSSPSSASADALGGKSGEEKLKCESCGETFKERHHLTRHMTSHNADRG